jgi:hypothetical protein
MAMTGRKLYTLWGVLGAAGLALCAVAQSESGGARKVVELLDKFVQPRFEKLDGRFGMSRMRGMNGHAAVVMTAENDVEKRLLKEAQTAGHSYEVHFMHIPHPKGTAPKESAPGGVTTVVRGPATKEPKYYLHPLQGIGKQMEPLVDPYRNQPEPRTAEEVSERIKVRTKLAWERTQRLIKLAEAEMPALMRGKSTERTHKNWLLAFRPVKASKQECVGCHTGSKMGDTLGAMIYAIHEVKDLPKQAALNNTIGHRTARP